MLALDSTILSLHQVLGLQVCTSMLSYTPMLLNEHQCKLCSWQEAALSCPTPVTSQVP
jgi:hypothetical protein